MPWTVTVLAAVAGGALLELLRVPAGGMIGAMIGVAGVNLLVGNVPPMPGAAKFAVYVVLGWIVGQGVTTEVLRSIVDNLSVIAVVVFALLVGGMILALLLVRWLNVDLSTAYLSACPGGISQMAALSSAAGANTGLVVSAHVARVVSVLVAAPWIVRIADSSTH